MKTNFKNLLPILLFTASPILIVAQTEKSKVKIPNSQDEKFEISLREDIPVRAVRRILNRYSNVTNLHWYAVENNLIAKFLNDSLETKLYFNNKGFWRETITSFANDQIPSVISDAVKSDYRDFRIIVAYKIETFATMVYMIKIENKRLLKTLKIKDGGIEVTNDYIKG
jgi:hypothetical protein